MTLLRYSKEVLADGAVGFWYMGPYMSYDGLVDFTQAYGVAAPYIDASTTFYGYTLIVSGTISYEVGAIPSMTDPVTMVAFGFSGGAGLAITYFPVVTLEQYFLGSLGVDVGDDFTWEFWIRTTQDPVGAVRLIEQASAGVYPYRIELRPGGTLRASRSDGTLTCTVDSVAVVNDDAWHYVTVSKSGSAWTIQVDTTTTVSVVDTLVGTTLLAVDGAIAGDGFEGALDELALYPLALSAAKRTRHLQAAAGTEVPV